MDQDLVDEMILKGVIEVSGIHKDTGEFLYGFSPNLKEIDPLLAQLVSELFYKISTNLWEKGFINADMTQEDPWISLTEKAFDEEQVSKLETFEKSVLVSIKENLEES